MIFPKAQFSIFYRPLAMTTLPWGFDVATSSLPALLVST